MQHIWSVVTFFARLFFSIFHSFKFWLCNPQPFLDRERSARGYDDRRHSRRIARAPLTVDVEKAHDRELSPCSSMLVYLKLGTVPKTVNGHHHLLVAVYEVE